jgi:hypothetical protein
MEQLSVASVSVSEDILKMKPGFFNYVGEERAIMPPVGIDH